MDKRTGIVRIIDTLRRGVYNKESVEQLIGKAVGDALADYELHRANLENAINADLSINRKEQEQMASKYRERVKVGVTFEGEPIYKWACANTKEELHAEIARLLQGGPDVLWEEIADEWFNVFHISKVREKTLSKDQSLFQRHVRPAFEGMPVKRITPTTVQEYLETKSMYCKSQVRDIMSMLKQIFSLAIDKGCMTINPIQSVLVFNPSKKPDSPRNAISKEHQADIIKHLEDLKNVYDRNGDNMNAVRFMAFLMYTGLRPCEVYGLRWEDLDMDNLTLTVNRDLVFVTGKGIIGEPKTPESKRTIPFDPNLIPLISPIQSNGYILHMTEKGREQEHLTEQAAINMWNRIKRHINVHGMTPYMARHTYATNMSKSGVPIKTAMSMMGHKDERMLLRRYTHTDTEDLTKAARSVSDYIDQNREKSEDISQVL